MYSRSLILQPFGMMAAGTAIFSFGFAAGTVHRKAFPAILNALHL